METRTIPWALLRNGLLLMLFLQACAPLNTTQKVGCRTWTGWNPQVSDSRASFDGFSILPPPKGNWCLHAKGDRFVTFATTPFIGKVVAVPPPRKHQTHNLLLGFVTVQTGRGRTDETRIQNVNQLQEFAKRWLRSGQGWGGTSINDPIYASIPKTPTFPDPDVVLIEDIDPRVEISNAFEADCVSYDYLVKLRGSLVARSPPSTLWTMHRQGFICLHPGSERVLVTGELRHSYVTGYDDNEVWREYWQQAERVFGSLEFTSL